MIQPPVDPNLEHRLNEKLPLRDDTNFASGKIAAFQYTTVAIFLFLISGFWRLQVLNPQIYDERAMQNSIKSVPILAPRGRILDRDGRVIVDNHSVLHPVAGAGEPEGSASQAHRGRPRPGL